VVTGSVPVARESEHYFFRLSAFEERLKSWVGSGAVQGSVARKLDEWFSQGLKDWDISRDAPYFGFEIPDAPAKYFYVWFDAPIGYLASFTQLCQRTGLAFEDFFAADSRAELHHFIGKDILYFHTLFWPAVLEGAGLRRPTAVHAHGFVTINGQKMSKSRGTFITARRYLQSFSAEYLRYYFAAKLGPGIDDIDMNLEEFATRLNSDLVGKLVNIASRCAGFISRHGGELAAQLPDAGLYAQFAAAAAPIASAYEARDTAGAMRDIMALADRANQYIDHHKPWLLAKDPGNAAAVRGVCTEGLNLFRALMIYLAPVLPDMATKARQFFREERWSWADAQRPLLGTAINTYEPLVTRLDPKAVAALIDPVPESPATSPSAAVAAGQAPQPPQPPQPPPRPVRPSPSTSSRAWTCAWRKSSRPMSSRVPTSCCGSAWISANSASAKSSPASGPPTNPRPWSGGSSSWWPICSRARCASASPTA
jgi:methionyl-tRNA synthetase